MECEWIYQHGWSYDRHCWDARWPKGIQLDRGYFGAPYDQVPPKAGKKRVLAAHSLGAHMLPAALLQSSDCLVLISAFKTLEPPTHPAALIWKRVVADLRQSLMDNPVEALRRFHERCYAPHKPPARDLAHLDLKRLLADLPLLANSELDLTLLRQVSCIILLAGERDQLVSPAKSRSLHEQLPNSQLHFIPGVGHALPFTHAAECLSSIPVYWTRS